MSDKNSERGIERRGGLQAGARTIRDSSHEIRSHLKTNISIKGVSIDQGV